MLRSDSISKFLAILRGFLVFISQIYIFFRKCNYNVLIVYLIINYMSHLLYASFSVIGAQFNRQLIFILKTDKPDLVVLFYGFNAHFLFVSSFIPLIWHSITAFKLLWLLKGKHLSDVEVLAHSSLAKQTHLYPWLLSPEIRSLETEWQSFDGNEGEAENDRCGDFK